jgi:enamine deaminase RidA (YjgF/YER057c/UK114 family)
MESSLKSDIEDVNFQRKYNPRMYFRRAAIFRIWFVLVRQGLPHRRGGFFLPANRVMERLVETSAKIRDPHTMSITRLSPEERLSGAVIGGGLIWLAGQVADDAGLDAEGQTADILKQIDALLAEAGTDKRALLSVTVILADIRDAPAMNRAWDRWLDQAHKPARMTIEAALVDPNWRVEITGVALAP